MCHQLPYIYWRLHLLQTDYLCPITYAALANIVVILFTCGRIFWTDKLWHTVLLILYINYSKQIVASISIIDVDPSTAISFHGPLLAARLGGVKRLWEVCEGILRWKKHRRRRSFQRIYIWLILLVWITGGYKDCPPALIMRIEWVFRSIMPEPDWLTLREK